MRVGLARIAAGTIFAASLDGAVDVLSGWATDPKVIVAEHAGIFVIGGWLLLEVIKMGKKMATRQEVQNITALVDQRSAKLRDDLSAALLNSDADHIKAFNELRSEYRDDIGDVHRRIDGLLDKENR